MTIAGLQCVVNKDSDTLRLLIQGRTRKDPFRRSCKFQWLHLKDGQQRSDFAILDDSYCRVLLFASSDRSAFGISRSKLDRNSSRTALVLSNRPDRVFIYSLFAMDSAAEVRHLAFHLSLFRRCCLHFQRFHSCCRLCFCRTSRWCCRKQQLPCAGVSQHQQILAIRKPVFR